MSNGVDGEGGDEWPKVKDATKGLRAILKDDSERRRGLSSSQNFDEELTEELFEMLSQ